MNTFAKISFIVGVLLLAQASQAFHFNIHLDKIRCSGRAAEIFGLTSETQTNYQPLSTKWIQDLLQAEDGYLAKQDVVAQPYGKLIKGLLSGEDGESLLMVVLTKRQTPFSQKFPFTLTLIIAGGEAKGFAGAQHAVQVDLQKQELFNDNLRCDLSQASK